MIPPNPPDPPDPPGPREARDGAVRRLRLDGREVRVLERGAGPPVMLIHGLGLGAGVWRPHLDRLAGAGYRVIAPDLPGFGRSDGPLTGLSVGAAAGWLCRLSDALGVERAAWVGHSLGAQQIVRLAASSPGRAEALILAAPTGRAGRHLMRQAGGLLATAFQERPRLVGDVLRRYLFAPTATVGSWIRAQPHTLALDAPRVSCPTLLVAGERDTVVPESFLELLLLLIPDATLRHVDGATHAVAIGPVDSFVDVLLDFLTRRYRSGDSTDRWKSSGIAPKSQGSSGP